MRGNLALNNRYAVWLMTALCAGLAGLLWMSQGREARAVGQASIIRLAVVHTPEDSGLLEELLPDFEKQTGYPVAVDSREDVYDVARKGQADLIISHYGHQGLESFIGEGLGLWPHPVFSNQAALLGPARDPAQIQGLSDAVEAFRRIATTRSPFLVNNGPAEKYLAEVLWEGAGRPERGEWYIDKGLREQPAIEEADRIGAYTLWGIVPFLKFSERSKPDLQALLCGDPLLQRLMVSVVVNPKKLSGINVEGAKALERFFIAPGTQARIRAFRYPSLGLQIWWPAGRNNGGAVLSGE